MFTNKKQIHIINLALLALGLLMSPIYGSYPSHKVNNKLEKAIEIRMKKGECLIPPGEFAWCKAVIVSYLASAKQDQFEKRLDLLRENIKPQVGWWYKKKKAINIDGEEIKRYYIQFRNQATYLKFLITKGQEEVFQNFIKNTGLNETNVMLSLQKTADILKTTIEVYKPSQDPCKLAIDKILVTSGNSSNNESSIPIRIVLDEYIKTEEREHVAKDNPFPMNNYRALLNNPSYWWPSSVVLQESKKSEEDQQRQFKNIQEKLSNIIKRAQSELFKSIENYDKEELGLCMNLYKTILVSGIAESMTRYQQTLPSLQDIKVKLNQVTKNIKKEAKKVDFTSAEYQQKIKAEKTTWFHDFSKKLNFLFFLESQLYTDESVGSAIQEAMGDRVKEAKEQVDKILLSSTLTEKDSESLNSYLQTFELFSVFIDIDSFDQIERLSKAYTRETISTLLEKVSKIKKEGIENLDNQPVLIKKLIELKSIEKYIDSVYIQTIDIAGNIEEILDEFKKMNGVNSGIRLNELSSNLRRHPMGGQLVAENKTFRGIAIMLRNTMFESIGIENILQHIREYNAADNNSSKSIIVKRKISQEWLEKIGKYYKRFTNEYWQLVKDNLGQQNAPDIILSLIKQSYIEKDQVPGRIRWNNHIREKVPSILAHIFAFWTLRNSQYYKQARGVMEKDREKYLLQPHAAQVVAILRMLGVDKGNLNSHLVQIGTGEGKSVVAFATATTLALLGFDVSCVCYSQYLSERDRKAFMPLIKDIGMAKHVNYTTFNQLCENIINEKGDVRSKIVALIKSTSNIDIDDEKDDEKKDDFSDIDSENDIAPFPYAANNIATKRARIIFIDEVDVFFNKNFYGSPYSPTALLQHPSISELITFVWKNRGSINYNRAKSSDTYKKCVTIFRPWERVLEEALKSMIADVKHFDSPPYIINNGYLCYKDGDGINEKITYNYKTSFACLKEKQKITKENFEAHMGLYLNSGVFSYAETPYRFTHILGVTGTLEKLSSVELEIIEGRYKVKQHTYIPSLYGESKRKFFKHSSQGLQVIENTYYPNYLKKEIIESLQGVSKKKRVFIKKKKLISKIGHLVNIRKNDASKSDSDDLSNHDDIKYNSENDNNNKKSINDDSDNDKSDSINDDNDNDKNALINDHSKNDKNSKVNKDDDDAISDHEDDSVNDDNDNDKNAPINDDSKNDKNSKVNKDDDDAISDHENDSEDDSASSDNNNNAIVPVNNNNQLQLSILNNNLDSDEEEEEDLSNKRAVIVFFKTSQELDSFLCSHYMEDIKQDINIMKSDLSYEEKNRRIAKAVMAGSITFSIREFGRGTDFVCYDTTVNQYGGVHVIITFFPENISEEVQIIGRTARQRNEGSVSMILKEGNLESLVRLEEIRSQRSISEDFYTLLNNRRKEDFASSYKNSIQHVDELKEEHKKATLFVENLWLGNRKEVTQHLLEYNAGPESKVTRTIVLVDATYSMGQLLLKTKNKIETMFKRITNILEDKSSCFSLQFVAYRNYNAPPHMILEISPWESNPQNLVQFMQNIKPNYGWENEAIEVGLEHVIREYAKEDVDQVILIGDMPPNTKEDVEYKRKRSSHQWDNHPLYSNPTFYKDEVDKIKNLGIPIHTFHIPLRNKKVSHRDTERVFREIAECTGGKCQLLDIRSEKGASQLIHIVSLRVLDKTGGTEAVESYVKKFGGKSFM